MKYCVYRCRHSMGTVTHRLAFRAYLLGTVGTSAIFLMLVAQRSYDHEQISIAFPAAYYSVASVHPHHCPENIKPGGRAIYDTPLLEAVRNGNIDQVRFLLSCGADVNLCRYTGWTALMEASSDGYTDIVRILLDHGAQVNAKTYTYEYDALMQASAEGHTDIVRILLDHGAQVNAKNYHGKTVLMSAAMGGHLDTVRLLLDRGANINAHDDFDWTALDSAIYSGNKDLIAFLRSKGAVGRFTK